jgi:membrane protease YdiL (CAAX protease family)
MSTPDRARPALTELALVVCGMVLGVATLFILRALGLWPTGTRGLGLISGPTITGIAALFYLWAQARLVEAGADAAPVHPPLPRAGWGRTAVVTALAIAAALGGSMVIGAAMELLGAPVSEQEGILEIVADWHAGTDRATMVILGVSAVVLLFTRLRQGSGRAVAYLASALAFAAIHGNPAGLLVYGWLGVVFAVALERTGRLSSAVLVHMGNNAFAFAALLLAP